MQFSTLSLLVAGLVPSTLSYPIVNRSHQDLSLSQDSLVKRSAYGLYHSPSLRKSLEKQRKGIEKQDYHGRQAGYEMDWVKFVAPGHVELSRDANDLVLDGLKGTASNAKKFGGAAKEVGGAALGATKEVLAKKFRKQKEPDANEQTDGDKKVQQTGNIHKKNEEIVDNHEKGAGKRMLKYGVHTAAHAVGTPVLGLPFIAVAHSANLLSVPVLHTPHLAKAAYHKSMQGFYKAKGCIGKCKEVTI